MFVLFLFLFVLDFQISNLISQHVDFFSPPKFSPSNDKNWFLQMSKETVAFAAEMDSRVCMLYMHCIHTK